MTEWSLSVPALPARHVARSLWRGFTCRCPNCGVGHLFRGYLKPIMTCTHCGEDLSHQRTDDAPPYFTMVLVGHIVVPIMLFVAFRVEWSNLTHLAVWLPLTLGLTLALLRPVKGATIGLQWALRMHGFDGSADPDAPAFGFLPVDRA